MTCFCLFALLFCVIFCWGKQVDGGTIHRDGEDLRLQRIQDFNFFLLKMTIIMENHKHTICLDSVEF